MNTLSIIILYIHILLYLSHPITATDLLYNSFTTTTNNSNNLLLIRDARFEPPTIRLSNDSNQWSIGRAFYSTPIQMTRTGSNSSGSGNSTLLTSFSTQFVFSILPESSSVPSFGITFVLSNTTEPPGAVGGQYLGLFTTTEAREVAPLVVVEFDTGTNAEFNENNGNHVGINLNNVVSEVYEFAGYYTENGSFVTVEMRNGQNVHVWIDFDGLNQEFTVTLAPVGIRRPARPLLRYRNSRIREYVSREMYVGFSASRSTWVEAQRILAWSFSDTGVARDINTTGLPLFLVTEGSGSGSGSGSGLSSGGKAGVIIGSVVGFLCLLGFGYYVWVRCGKKDEEEDEVEDWELEFWPHRYSYEELNEATNGFSDSELLGAGGFGKVYKGTLSNKMVVAVKCVNDDSKQGLREFMAEISSMGRLQHKNLVQMKGWCRKRNELLLVYDYMPNGSLNTWIFDTPKSVLSWEGRKKVLVDVAKGLNYLHHGWEQVVVHRDIKSSNVLLDSDMRGRLGDFGLAKLYTQGEEPGTTRVVGTLGYLAPELMMASPTTASDVYSFGVVVLEVACGRKPIQTWQEREEHVILVDLVREKYMEGKLGEVADKRIKGQYPVEEMEGVLKLGLNCCHLDPQQRPTMSEVVALLLSEDISVASAFMLQEIKKEPSP